MAKYLLFWAYGDGNDSPYLVIDPPDNLGELLTRWNALDQLFVADQPLPEPWQPVNVWLQAQGVNIAPIEEIRLDDH